MPQPITDEELHYLTIMASMSVPGCRHGGQLVAAMVLQQREEINELKNVVARLISQLDQRG